MELLLTCVVVHLQQVELSLTCVLVHLQQVELLLTCVVVHLQQVDLLLTCVVVHLQQVELLLTCVVVHLQQVELLLTCVVVIFNKWNITYLMLPALTVVILPRCSLSLSIRLVNRVVTKFKTPSSPPPPPPPPNGLSNFILARHTYQELELVGLELVHAGVWVGKKWPSIKSLMA